jgi:hypothetical protein
MAKIGNGYSWPEFMTGAKNAMGTRFFFCPVQIPLLLKRTRDSLRFLVKFKSRNTGENQRSLKCNYNRDTN